MTDQEFWELIDKINLRVLPNETRMLAPLRLAMKKGSGGLIQKGALS